MNHDPLVLTFAALLGAIVGSFLNVVILRLPETGASIVFPASHCPKCRHPLSWVENIPLCSYLLLRGKCSHCGVHISLQYPLVELMMAILSAGLVYRFGVSLTTAGFFFFTASLLVIIIIDLNHQIIPDVISLPGIVLGFFFSFFNTLCSWQESLIGLLAGGGILYAIALLYYVLRKQDGMGGGDIKLLAMLGAFLGWQSLPFIIFASSVSGSVIGIVTLAIQRKDSATRIPFGPFLSVSALFYMFFTKEIQSIYKAYLTGTLL